MKKIFLTSGVLMCMACPTIAEAAGLGFTDKSVDQTGSGSTATFSANTNNNGTTLTSYDNYSAKDVANACVVAMLDKTTGTASLQARWENNFTEINLSTNTAGNGWDGSSTVKPTKIYGILGGAAGSDHVYQGMDSNGNLNSPIAVNEAATTQVPAGKSLSFVYNYNYANISGQTGKTYTAVTTEATASTAATRQFKGFFSTDSGTGTASSTNQQYLDAGGKLTSDGLSAAGRTTPQTWYAQYACATPTKGTPALTGYTFAGWALTATGSVISDFCITKGSDIDGNDSNTATTRTLFAKWTPTDTTITLNMTDGKTAASPATLYARYDVGAFTSSSNRSSFTPSNTGKVMTTSANAITSNPVGKDVVITYSVDTRPTNPVTNKQYDVTLVSGGTANATTTTTKARTFGGFYSTQTDYTGTACTSATKNASGSTQYMGTNKMLTSSGVTKSKALTSNATWYAKWTATAQTLNTPNTSIKGYNFDGWYNETGTKVGDAGATYSPYCSTTLHGKWTKKQYDVIYNKGAHASTSAVDYTHSKGATYDEAYTIPADSSTSGTAGYGVKNAKIAATGYTFIGWTTDSTPTVTRTSGVHTNTETSGTVANKYTSETYWQRDTNLNLYAAYLANQYKVTYSCGTAANVSGTAPSATYGTYDAAYTLATNGSSNCKRTGYTFDKWSCGRNLATNATSTTTYASGASVSTFKATADVTCTATWKANTINLTWSVNHGTEGTRPGGTNCTYDSSVTLPSNPTRVGYTFNGWEVANN